MQDLPTLFRALADACEANGGSLPDEIMKPALPVRKNHRRKAAKKTDASGNAYTQHITRKHFYGK